GQLGAEALAQSPYVGNLTALELSHNPLGDAGVAALARSSRLGRLTSLDLTGTSVTSRGVRALAESPHLANLRRLPPANNHLDADAARALASSPFLGELRLLDLSWNFRLGPEDFKAIAFSPNLPRLIVLNTSGPVDSPQQLRRLGRDVAV